MSLSSESHATRSVERALRLLVHVTEHAPTTLSDCSRSLGIPVTTALRLLRTLEGLGFVRREADGVFQPGARAFRLGAIAISRHQLVTVAVPALRRLATLSGESAYLAVVHGTDEALFIAMAEGTQSIRHVGWVGRTAPMAGTALGRALSDDCADDFVVGRSESEPDVTAIASPVRWRGGVLAAVNVVGPAYRLDHAHAATVGAAVAAEARSITDALFPAPASEVTRA